MVGGFVLVGAEVVERGVHPPRVVEGLDVVEDPEPGDVAGREDVLLDEFEFDRAGLSDSLCRQGLT